MKMNAMDMEPGQNILFLTLWRSTGQQLIQKTNQSDTSEYRIKLEETERLVNTRAKGKE